MIAVLIRTTTMRGTITSINQNTTQHNTTQHNNQIISIGEQSYRHLMPSSAVLIDPKSFDKTALVERSRKKIGLEGVPAGRPGMTCDEVRTIFVLSLFMALFSFFHFDFHLLEQKVYILILICYF